MIEQLYIKNVALIDEVLIYFNKGLNILSGETGAGKSIIIGSINFVLGGRATKDFIQKDYDQAKVEVLLSINSNEILEEILEAGIEIEEDKCILISRVYTRNGRNICKINGKPATISMIKSISTKLIDIHGQHEHQSLLDPKKHILLLDKFCAEKMIVLKEQLLKNIVKYRELLKQISAICIGKNRDEKVDFLKFQINEIEEANLNNDEENMLNEKRTILSQAGKLKKYYEDSLYLLYNSETMSALDNIAISIDNLSNIINIDCNAQGMLSRLQEIYVKLEDVIYSLRKNNDNIIDNPNELNFIEERLDLINKLKRKYGSNIEEILKFYETAKFNLQRFLDSEKEVSNLMEKKNLLEVKIKEICFKLNEIRKNKAIELEQKIEAHLFDLGMKNTKFKISISNKGSFGKDGFDKVEFLIATNKGDNLKPLSKIASGGEMSRIMLSLKAVLAIADNIETFIFDEIDSGISGRTAQMVAEKMSLLATQNQIICITHLPQIATMGDTHFLIQKFDKENSTSTSINILDEQQTIHEIARMTGGAVITQFTLASAKEMLEQSKKIKKAYGISKKKML